MQYCFILFSWLIFALWGVASREINLPIPILLLIVSFFGFLTAYMLKPSKIKLNDRNAIIVSIFLILDLLFLLIAFKNISFATTITIHYFAPIWVALASNLVLRERRQKHDLILSIVGFLGVIVLFYHEIDITNNLSTSIYGLMAAFLSSITLAGNILYQRLYMKDTANYIDAVKHYNFYIFMAYFLIIAPIWYIIYGYEDHTIIQNIDYRHLIYAALAGIFIQGIAMLLFNYSIKYISAIKVSQMAYTEIAWVVLLGYALYDENISYLQSIGMIVILFVAYKGGNNETRR